MARDQEPMTDEELAEAKQRLEDLRERVRHDLAEDLGGDPDEYDATRRPVPDGGEGTVGSRGSPEANAEGGDS